MQGGEPEWKLRKHTRTTTQPASDYLISSRRRIRWIGRSHLQTPGSNLQTGGTRREGLCVHINIAWCKYWKLTSNVKMLISTENSLCCGFLRSPWSTAGMHFLFCHVFIAQNGLLLHLVVHPHVSQWHFIILEPYMSRTHRTVDLFQFAPHSGSFSDVEHKIDTHAHVSFECSILCHTSRY